MTTVQEPLTNAIPPFPFFIENPVVLHRNDLPTNKDNNNQFASDDQVVERQKGVPITPLLAHEKVALDTNPLTERCQFSFSDGRQCRMARSEIHPSLCPYHAEREEQLFGTPAPGGNVVGAALDLPELYSACRDLTTAAGVNRALAQVFRLLAQRRISRQEAATFGHLAQLLLRTISAMRAESVAVVGDGARADSRLTPRREANAAPASCPEADDATGIVIPNPPSADVSSNQRAQTAGSNSRKMNTCAKSVSNPSKINTYENDDPTRIVVPSEQREPRDLSQGAQNQQIRCLQLQVT